MIRPIAIGLAPNLEFDDIFQAFLNIILGKILFNKGESLKKIKSWLKKNLGFKNIYLFNSGRSALFVALSSLGITEGDEVLLQAFTCVAVPNAIIWSGAKPVYVDIKKDTLGMDPVDCQKKITKRTKAIIIQHTFGIPADIEMILKIAKKFGLFVIEDCAHGIKIPYRNKMLGQFGDLAFFSFGRDKAISSVFGGALIINNKKLTKQIKKNYRYISYPSKWWILKQYLHILSMIIILPFYNFLKIGRVFLFLLQKLSLLTPPVYEEERCSKQPNDFPKRLPEALADFAFHQLKKVDKFNNKRKRWVKLYNQKFPNNIIKTDSYPLLRYPLIIEERDELMKKAFSKNIFLGTWYGNIIDPKGVDLQTVSFTKPCPTASYVAQHIVNLPTYPTLNQKDIEKIFHLFNQQIKINYETTNSNYIR